MALNLHNNCLEQLRTKLESALGQVTVRNNMFLDDMPECLAELDTILPRTGAVHEKLQKYIGESPFLDFVTETLSRELFEQQAYSRSDSKPLSEIEAYADIPSLASRLVDAFNSLPWQYTVTLPLPTAFSRIFGAHITNFDLSDSLSIRMGRSLIDEFPLLSGIKARDKVIARGSLTSLLGVATPDPSWESDRAYLQVKCNGYFGKFTATEPQKQAVDTMRSFHGICLAQRLLMHVQTYETSPSRELYYIHRHIDNAWIVEEADSLEDRHLEILRHLQIDYLGSPDDPDDVVSRRMIRELTTMTAIYRDTDRSKNLILGAQWLLDSYGGRDELLKFVQAAVVIEILLGDKASSDQTGLSELLANRCAYLIAHTHSQRSEVLVKFRRIYDVRSKIVHRGKNRLTQVERELLHDLRWLCFRIIQDESRLIEKDSSA